MGPPEKATDASASRLSSGCRPGAKDALPHLVECADQGEPCEREEDALGSKGRSLEIGLHEPPIDRGDSKHHLSEEHDVQRGIWETVAAKPEDPLRLRRRRDGRSNLTENQ